MILYRSHMPNSSVIFIHENEHHEGNSRIVAHENIQLTKFGTLPVFNLNVKDSTKRHAGMGYCTMNLNSNYFHPD